LQPRYAKAQQEMKNYIKEELESGFVTENRIFYQTGFIIYNMQHADTESIQELWYVHIKRIGGMQCQIAFFFVSQRFLGENTIQEYLEEWNYGRKLIHEVFPV
jgi:hypothetical protein